jgi:hypothetical protein
MINYVLRVIVVKMSGMNKVVLMYHSVSSLEQPEVAGSFPISFNRFKYQVESLIELGYESSKVSDLFVPANSDKKLFYITGDDGTVDWSRNVLQWCEANKIYTHTGIITGPWENKPVYPLTHIVQLILSNRSNEDLKLLVKKILPYLEKEQLEYIHDIYSYEDVIETRLIKGAFNLIFQEEEAVELIGDLTDEEVLLLHQRFEVSEFYKQFRFAEVGVHTRTHTALDLSLDSYLDNEIDASKLMLVKKELNDSAFFTLPMKPKYGATVDSLIEPLKTRGYKGILTSYSGFWDMKSFVIPRIDACEMEKIIGISDYRDSA